MLVKGCQRQKKAIKKKISSSLFNKDKFFYIYEVQFDAKSPKHNPPLRASSGLKTPYIQIWLSYSGRAFKMTASI